MKSFVAHLMIALLVFAPAVPSWGQSFQKVERSSPIIQPQKQKVEEKIPPTLNREPLKPKAVPAAKPSQSIKPSMQTPSVQTPSLKTPSVQTPPVKVEQPLLEIRKVYLHPGTGSLKVVLRNSGGPISGRAAVAARLYVKAGNGAPWFWPLSAIDPARSGLEKGMEFDTGKSLPQSTSKVEAWLTGVPVTSKWTGMISVTTTKSIGSGVQLVTPGSSLHGALQQNPAKIWEGHTFQGKPDLVVTRKLWSAQPQAGHAIGTAALLNISVTNEGIAPSTATIYSINPKKMPEGYQPGETQALVMYVQIPSLNPGQSYNFGWPNYSEKTWRPGTYIVKSTIFTDGTDEFDTKNNTEIIIFEVAPRPGSGPDLQTSNFKGPQVLFSGSTYIFSVSVRNIGATTSPACKASVTLHPSGSGVYYPIAIVDVPSYLPGWGSTITIEATVPDVQPGVYGVNFIADYKGEISESNEGNNNSFYGAELFLKNDNQ